jgi:hypothetical protein
MKKTKGLTVAAAIMMAAMVLAGCGGKKNSASGGGDAGLNDALRTAAESGKALDSGKGGGTASKPEDFKYDLTADGNGVVIQGVTKANVSAIKVPDKIEGYPVVEIAKLVFGDQKNITSVTLPKTVTTLGRQLFYGMESLSKIDLPPGITVIPEDCFYKCKSLSTVKIPDGVTKIEEDAFCLSGIKEIVIPDSVTTIGGFAFSDCSELTSVKLPSHPIEYTAVFSGDIRTFSNCPKLSLAIRKAIQDSGYKDGF